MVRKVQRTALAVAGLLLVWTLSTVPVMAQSDNRPSQDSLRRQAQSDSTTTTQQSESQDTTRQEQARERAQLLKEKNAQKTETLKAQTSKTPEERTTACEARKGMMKKRMSRTIERAEKHVGVFDGIYVRLTQFKTNKKLDAQGYDQLVAVIDDAKAKATVAINTLKEVDLPIDCSQPDAVATALGSFKDAASEAKQALKEYQQSIKNLASALKAAADKAESATTGESSDGSAGQEGQN